MCSTLNITDDNSTDLGRQVVNLQTSTSRLGKVHSEVKSDGEASAKRTNTARLISISWQMPVAHYFLQHNECFIFQT